MRIAWHIIVLGAVVLFAAGCEMGHTADPEPDDADSAAVGVEQMDAPPAPANVPDFDGDRSVAEHLNDATLATKVQQALVRERSLRAFDFDTEAEAGYVTLRGDVDTRDQYDRAARVAATVDGVEAVVNEVTVEGNPISDHE